MSSKSPTDQQDATDAVVCKGLISHDREFCMHVLHTIIIQQYIQNSREHRFVKLRASKSALLG